MELQAKTTEQIAAMSAQDRVLYIQEARNKIANGGELPDDIYASVLGVLRFERRASAAATPAGKKAAGGAAKAAPQALSLEDL